MTRRGAADFMAVVVGAGCSARFGDSLPKQFHDLGGRSVLERSVRGVVDRPGVGGAIVVLAAGEADGARAREVESWSGVERVVAGGASRAESVLAGVRAAAQAPHVLVHDAARPLVSPGLVDAVIEATRVHGAAVPVLPITDTVKSLEGPRVMGTLPRDGLGRAQTPQGARTDRLRAALERAGREGAEVTDESSALERAGETVFAVAGEAGNRKITTATDLERARRELDPTDTGLRVGCGFDVHRVDPSRPLVLGGLLFEEAPGLAGHSDADVVLHAAMDALLGAAGLGDIGAHFPPGDERFAGAASTDLAGQVATMLSAGGFRIVNLDLTLLAEAPRIRDRVEPMRRAIAGCLGTVPSRVGLKATTLERLGALGRGEGIACQAVALIVAVSGGRE